jgi:GTPase SAR1 family protein
MIYQFPTKKTLDSALKGETGSLLESFIDTNLPSGKIGKLVELAIEIQTGAAIKPFIYTKVPIGQRDKMIEICFHKNNSFFICSLASSSRVSTQLLDLAEVVDFADRVKPSNLELVPILVLPDKSDLKQVVENSEIFKNIELHTIQRSTLCDTLNAWQS